VLRLVQIHQAGVCVCVCVCLRRTMRGAALAARLLKALRPFIERFSISLLNEVGRKHTSEYSR
jgi:hypothetical protein